MNDNDTSKQSEAQKGQEKTTKEHAISAAYTPNKADEAKRIADLARNEGKAS
jgi:hypothetical protein